MVTLLYKCVVMVIGKLIHDHNVCWLCFYVKIRIFSFTYIWICDLTLSGLVFIDAYFSAVEEDANRAIELKNGSSVGGRKIAVKHAMPRPPREERKSKPNQGWLMLLSNSVSDKACCDIFMLYIVYTFWKMCK